MITFPLDKSMQATISVDDLSIVVLQYFQQAYRMNRNVPSPMQKLNILSGITGDNQAGFENSSFDQNFGYALSELLQHRLIAKSPWSDDSYVLTDAGIVFDDAKPLFELTGVDEFISICEMNAGTMDEVARDYLRESFLAAKAKLWKSSVFMLGASAERFIYVLAEHIDAILTPGTATGRFDSDALAKTQKDWVVRQIPQLKKQFAGSVGSFRELEDTLNTLFAIYRRQRNEVGHPNPKIFAPQPEREKALLMSFELSAKAVNDVLLIR